MNLNVLRPGDAVKSAFEKPNILIALVLVIVPSLIAALSFLLNSANVEWAVFAWEFIVKEYILFFVIAITVFILGILLNGQKAKGKFIGTVTAIGLMYLLAIVMAVLSLFSRLLFSPQFFSALQKLSSANISTEEFAVNAQLLMQTMPGGINMAGLALIVIIGIILALWKWVILYKTISFLSERKPWLNLIALVITVFVWSFAAVLL